MGDGEGLKLDFPTKIHSNRTKIAKDILCFFNVLDGWLGWAPWAESHHVFIFRYIPPKGAAVAYWLERRIQDRNEDFEREFESPLTHTLSKVQDAQ